MRALLLAFALLAVPLLSASTARAEQVFWSQEALLVDMFPTAERRIPRTLTLSPAQVATVTSALGYAPARASYAFIEAWRGEELLGWVLLDEQVGQHEPITFAVQIGPDGRVLRHEVVVYRERYGAEVRDKRFRAQFVGKSASDPIVAGRDIRIVSGATYSSKAMAIGVKRAVVLASLLSAPPGA